MLLTVNFYSYFKELTGCAQTVQEAPEGASLDTLFKALGERFPKLAPMERCALMAVGVEYQPRDYTLKAGDEISLFPPVQGG